MNGDLIIVGILALVIIGYQGWLIKKMMERFDEERKDLLNRVMARNYETFVQGDVVRAEVKKTLTDEEIAMIQAERGIPV